MGRALLIVGLLSVLAPAAGASGRSPGSGIAGRVVAGPVCPVETVPPRPACRPRPLVATLRIRSAGVHGRWTSVHTGAGGRFRVRLRPGVYTVRTLSPTGSPLPRPPADRRVRVRGGHFTAVVIVFDTGIR